MVPNTSSPVGSHNVLKTILELGPPIGSDLIPSYLFTLSQRGYPPIGSDSIWRNKVRQRSFSAHWQSKSPWTRRQESTRRLAVSFTSRQYTTKSAARSYLGKRNIAMDRHNSFTISPLDLPSVWYFHHVLSTRTTKLNLIPAFIQHERNSIWPRWLHNYLY